MDNNYLKALLITICITLKQNWDHFRRLTVSSNHFTESERGISKVSCTFIAYTFQKFICILYIPKSRTIYKCLVNYFKHCFATKTSRPTSYQLSGFRPISSPAWLQVRLLDWPDRCTPIQWSHHSYKLISLGSTFK